MDNTYPAERLRLRRDGVLYLSLIWFPPRNAPQSPPHSGMQRVMVWPDVLHESSSRPFRRDARGLAPVFAHHVYNGSQPPRTAPVSERRCRSARPINTRAQREGPIESDYGKERRSFGGGALFVIARPSPRPSTGGRADANSRAASISTPVVIRCLRQLAPFRRQQ
jgi:hypothetical protein